MKYTITGMFEIETDAEDVRDAKAYASQRLNEAGVKHFVIDARKENNDAEETQKRTPAGETEAAMQNQAETVMQNKAD